MKKLITVILIVSLVGFYNFVIVKKETKKVTKLKTVVKKNKIIKKKKMVVFLQPLGDVGQPYIDVLKNSIETFYGFDCVIKEKIDFTNDILSKSKTRYDADKILNKFNGNNYLIIITEKDIACKNENIPEWGIFGLGFCPGKTCVLSTFRLKRNVTEYVVMERLKKIVLHEIGHNLGLDHCSNDKKCMMNDADGTIKQVDRENIWLCNKCKVVVKIYNPLFK